MSGYRISAADRQAFARDGVICLRQALAPDLIAILADGIDSCLARPGPKGRNFNADGSPGRFAGDVFMWTFDDAVRDFLFRSPLAEIAAAFMGSETAVHMLDQMFVKEPRTPARSPWHQDQTYMYADGEQLISIWVAADPVTRDSGAVEWVKGSHRSGALYQATGFDPNITYESDDYDPLPDIDAIVTLTILLPTRLRPATSSSIIYARCMPRLEISPITAGVPSLSVSPATTPTMSCAKRGRVRSSTQAWRRGTKCPVTCFRCYSRNLRRCRRCASNAPDPC